MGEDRGGHICFTEFYRRNFFMNAKGRIKEDGAFLFYEQESFQRGMSYHARRTTHDARPTTHDPINHLHISHNVPYLPPKILHKHCFQFLLGRL